MNKKLMAVAVASALAAPALALAQASTVNIYGYINAEYGFAQGLQKPAGGTQSWDGLNSPGSYIGFKGEEKLGGGLSAWFQCETDTGFLKGDQAVSTLHNATQGGWCSRNSALGVKGGFGSVYIGSWDSPMKRAVGKHRVAGETGWLGVQHYLISNGGTYTGSFSVRNSNSINWDSPSFNGFSASLSTTSTKDSATVATAGLKGRHTSGSLSYTAGPVDVVVARTVADDNRSIVGAGGANGLGLKDTAMMLGGSYTIGAAKISALYIDSDTEQSATTGMSRKSWNLGGTYKLAGAHSLMGAYTVAGDTNTKANAQTTGFGANSGANQYTLGYINALSKRTNAGLYYIRAKNDSNATGYAVGGQASTGLVAGSSNNAVIMRLTHSF